MKAQWPLRLLGSKMRIVCWFKELWLAHCETKQSNVFCIIFWALCPMACRVTRTAPSWWISGGQWQQAGWLPCLARRTGTVPIIPTDSPSSLLPMLGQRSQLKRMKIWRGRGEAGREWRACSYFLIMKLLSFNSLTLENPFVNCFNNSKTWYKTEDSRLLLGLPTFFSCHLSQGRISTLEAAV